MGDHVVIVDTTVWVDYLNGVSTPQVEWLDRESDRQRLGLLDLMVCEILQDTSPVSWLTRAKPTRPAP